MQSNASVFIPMGENPITFTPMGINFFYLERLFIFCLSVDTCT